MHTFPPNGQKLSRTIKCQFDRCMDWEHKHQPFQCQRKQQQFCQWKWGNIALLEIPPMKLYACHFHAMLDWYNPRLQSQCFCFQPVLLFSKVCNMYFWILWSKKLFLQIIKMNNFRGDLTDLPAKKETLAGMVSLHSADFSIGHSKSTFPMFRFVSSRSCINAPQPQSTFLCLAYHIWLIYITITSLIVLPAVLTVLIHKVTSTLEKWSFCLMLMGCSRTFAQTMSGTYLRRTEVGTKLGQHRVEVTTWHSQACVSLRLDLWAIRVYLTIALRNYPYLIGTIRTRQGGCGWDGLALLCTLFRWGVASLGCPRYDFWFAVIAFAHLGSFPVHKKLHAVRPTGIPFWICSWPYQSEVSV